MPATFLDLGLLGVRQNLAGCSRQHLTHHFARLSKSHSVTSTSAYSTTSIRQRSQPPLTRHNLKVIHHTVTSAVQVRRHFSKSSEMASKRKNSPVTVMGRPSKIYKQDLYLNKAETGENGQPPTEDEQYIMDMDGDADDRISLPPVAATADTAEWQATIEKVVRNVVSIHFCQTCSFDTDPAISSEATGFVVDAEKGYILTNRHVVGAGPFWGYCIFDNHEEVHFLSSYSILLCLLTLLAVRCLSRLSRSSTRLRYPPLRPQGHQIHAPDSVEPETGPGKSGSRNPGGW